MNLKSDTETKTNMKNILIRTVRLIWRNDRKYIFVSSVSTILLALLPAMSLLTMQNIINLLQVGKIRINEIFMYIGIYISIDLFQTLIQSLVGLFNTKFRLNFNLMIKEKILEKSKNLRLKDYEDSETYDMIRLAQSEGGEKLISYFMMFVQIIGTIITMISYMTILLSFRTWLVLVVFTIPIIKYFIMKKINLKQFNMIRERTGDQRKAWYWSYLITNGQNYKELKIYNLFDYFIKKHRDYVKKFNIQDFKIAKESALYLVILSILEQLLDGTIFAYIVYSGYSGIILIGNVITYTRSIMETKSNVQKLLETFSNIQKESLFIGQLYKFLDMNNKDMHVIRKEKLKNIDEIKEIRVKNLYYKYHNDDDYVLKNINMTIRVGESFAILGRNGSGKTTLAKVIMGFYDDYEGKIYINGIDLKEIDKTSYMERVGTLFQEFSKYEATLRENISYGNLDIIDNDNYLVNIGSKFKIQELIDNGYKGLDMQLGYWFDDGKQISIGQWQKIALSRAFAKKADIYILDEPNAALDAISEYDLSIMYKDLFANKIGLIIAHRFNNFIKQVDKIIVIEDGNIVESGTHIELIKKRGLYSKLYNLQIGEYEEDIIEMATDS